MDTSCNIMRKDIVLLASFINLILPGCGKASHAIFAQYEGDGYVPLATQITLVPTDQDQITCSFIGSSRVDIVWKWRGGSHSFDTDHYFDPPVSKIGSGDSQISSSHLEWKFGITDTEKRSASGIIYAEGTHEDTSGVSTCDDVTLTIVWKPEKPSLSINKDPLHAGQDTTAQLSCQLTDKGNPESQVRWIKNGNVQSGSEYNTHTISIPVTKEINGDKWQCHYYNTAGDGDYSNETMIYVHWSPGVATISADTQTPKRDDTLTFLCTGDRGNPPGQVLWYLDTRLVANTTNKQHRVTDVKKYHNGKWSCMFTNNLNVGAKSQSIYIQVLYLPGVHIDYITYEFTSESVSFTLKITDLFAAVNLEVSVCSVDDNPSCNTEQQFIIEHSSTIEQRVIIPESSDGEIYNVTFTFSDEYRIVTRHGMALKGPVVQSQIPTILAVLLGTLLIVAIVTIIALVYVLHWRNKSKGIPVPRENSVQYVNVGPDGNAGDITHIQAAPEYEDVNAAATINGDSSNIGNATYMDLDQNDIQQTRNRPAEVTVYQSLN